MDAWLGINSVSVFLYASILSILVFTPHLIGKILLPIYQSNQQRRSVQQPPVNNTYNYGLNAGSFTTLMSCEDNPNTGDTNPSSTPDNGSKIHEDSISKELKVEIGARNLGKLTNSTPTYGPFNVLLTEVIGARRQLTKVIRKQEEDIQLRQSLVASLTNVAHITSAQDQKATTEISPRGIEKIVDALRAAIHEADIRDTTAQKQLREQLLAVEQERDDLNTTLAAKTLALKGTETAIQKLHSGNGPTHNNVIKTETIQDQQVATYHDTVTKLMSERDAAKKDLDHEKTKLAKISQELEKVRNELSKVKETIASRKVLEKENSELKEELLELKQRSQGTTSSESSTKAPLVPTTNRNKDSPQLPLASKPPVEPSSTMTSSELKNGIGQEIEGSWQKKAKAPSIPSTTSNSPETLAQSRYAPATVFNPPRGPRPPKDLKGKGRNPTKNYRSPPPTSPYASPYAPSTPQLSAPEPKSEQKPVIFGEKRTIEYQNRPRKPFTPSSNPLMSQSRYAGTSPESNEQYLDRIAQEYKPPGIRTDHDDLKKILGSNASMKNSRYAN